MFAKNLSLLAGCVFLFTIRAVAQPSFSFSVGPTISTDTQDYYSLKNTWALKTGNPSDPQNSMNYFAGGTGLMMKLGLMWEVSEHFSAGLIYQNVNWPLSDSKRDAKISSFGVQFRVNFASNLKKFVPFIQGTYLFSNASELAQTQATLGSQTQPSFTKTGTSSIGFGGELGLEYKLANSWAIQIIGGFHGVQAVEDDGFVQSLDYGLYTSPNHMDGGFFYAFTGGIKYYVGRSTKKRDF